MSLLTQGPKYPGTTANDSSSSGSISWTNPDNSKLEDSIYATATLANPQFTYYLKVTNYNFTIPTYATIKGILVEVRENTDSGTSMRNLYAKIVKSNGTIGTTNKAASEIVPTTDTYKQYGSNADLWGETWTPSDINNSNFGFAFCAQEAAAGTNTISVDDIRITVYYTTITGPFPTYIQS